MSNEKDETKTKEGSTNPYAWREEFEFPAEEIAKRGEPVGYMRFVAFQPDDPSKASLMHDVVIDDEFTAVMVKNLISDKKLLRYFKKLVFMADSVKDLQNGNIGAVIDRVLSRASGSPSSFMPGGMSFGERDEIEEIFGRIKRPRNPLSDLGDFLSGKPRRGNGIEVNILGFGGGSESSELDELLEALREGGPGAMAALARKKSGGEGCDCDECKAERARVAKAKADSGGDNKEPANNAEEKPEE